VSTEFDQVERMLEVQRRQAVALEAIAGVLLMQYSLRDDTGCWDSTNSIGKRSITGLEGRSGE